MRKFLTITIITLLFTLNSNAQLFEKSIKGNGNLTTKTRTTTSYDQIKSAGSFDIQLVAGKEGNLTIEAESNLMIYIITEVKDNMLKLRWKKGTSINRRKRIVITIPIEDIDAIYSVGSGNINSDTPIMANDLIVSLKGSGNMNLTVNCNTIQSKIIGSGNIKISGKTDDLNCSISGSGDFNGISLKTKTSTVRISGSGDCSLDVSDDLQVRISGSGDVDYTGNPTIKVRISGSGDVKQR